MSASYVIEGDLTEDQIEADVAQYPGWRAHDLPFRVHDVNEQLTGADKMCDVVDPIYIQFKKSTGLHSVESLPIKPRSSESALQEIRRFRAGHDLPDNPTLFFELRKQAKEDLQGFGGDVHDDFARLIDSDSDARVIRRVQSLLDSAAQRRASDVHIEPMARQLIVRFRIDGRLVDAGLRDIIREGRAEAVVNPTPPADTLMGHGLALIAGERTTLSEVRRAVQAD